MLRAALIVATVVALGCPSSPPIAQPKVAYDDVAVRIHIAELEARRAAGVDELEKLAHGGDIRQRVLALRGLGRIGTPQAVNFLKGQLRDGDDAILAAALAALGVAGALDDTAPLDGIFTPREISFYVAPNADAPTVTLTREQQIAFVEAVGRAAGVDDESTLVKTADRSGLRAVAALALGRMGRRKLAWSPSVRAWLASATDDPDRDVRYAATYALGREHEPPADEVVLAALAARVTDDDAEIRAQAIAALAKRGAIEHARKAIEDSLRDRDWRVAVEAVRALAGEHGDIVGKRAVTSILDRRWSELVAGHDSEAQVIVEALRLLAKPPSDQEGIIHFADLVKDAPGLAAEWTQCLAGAVRASARGKYELAAPCVRPAIWGLTAATDLVAAGGGTIPERRAALRGLLEHGDPRVRAAAIAALVTLWKDGDANDRRAIVTTMIAALASPNPIIAGSAVDAAPGLYDAIDAGGAAGSGANDPERGQLDAAIVQRATRETDVELGASLYELIGKRAIGAGAAACRAGLTGHIVRARAAAECLKKLGEAVPVPTIGAAEPPPNIDVKDVIGKQLYWHVTTSRGDIVIQLRPDVAPWNVATIVALTRRHFYDGLAFHRVVPDFVVQGGDPTQSGWGGPGFTTPAEPATSLDGDGFVTGGVGIADAGRDSGGSQWFVMHSRAPHLDGRYTWIGSVISGQKSADALLIGDTVIRACIETRNYGGSADVSTSCK